MKKNKSSQGEIFGVALVFVLIVLGIIIYSQISKFSPDRDEENLKSSEYNLLAQTALDSIMEMSSGCVIENGKDSISDLINYCLSESSVSVNGPEITCDSGVHFACEHSAELVSDSLINLFGGEDFLGNSIEDSDILVAKVPYNFSITIPHMPGDFLFKSLEINNFDYYFENNFDTSLSNRDNLRKLGYKRAPSGIYVWKGAQYWEIYVDLNIYYK